MFPAVERAGREARSICWRCERLPVSLPKGAILADRARRSAWHGSRRDLRPIGHSFLHPRRCFSDARERAAHGRQSASDARGGADGSVQGFVRSREGAADSRACREGVRGGGCGVRPSSAGVRRETRGVRHPAAGVRRGVARSEKVRDEAAAVSAPSTMPRQLRERVAAVDFFVSVFETRGRARESRGWRVQP
jgi:hypothetical protein